MNDWNEVLDAGDVAKGVVNVVVEIPAGSNNKVEWRRDLGLMMLDRVEPEVFAKPTNYGFIPLDALGITDKPLPTGVFLKARVLGVLKFVDGGEVDDKVIVVPEDDRQTGNHIRTIDDVPEQLKKQIVFHFSHYKDLKKPGSTEVRGIEGYDEAIETIKLAQKRWADR